jgi:putative FmdB family regulatory protein
MPLYEYRCEDCGVRFERRQKFSDEPLRDCPECGGSVHRVIGPTGIIFKGSGFYVTDNRKGSGRSSTKNPANGSAEKKSSEGAESTSESTTKSSDSSSSKTDS